MSPALMSRSVSCRRRNIGSLSTDGSWRQGHCWGFDGRGGHENAPLSSARSIVSSTWRTQCPTLVLHLATIRTQSKRKLTWHIRHNNVGPIQAFHSQGVALREQHGSVARQKSQYVVWAYKYATRLRIQVYQLYLIQIPRPCLYMRYMSVSQS